MLESFFPLLNSWKFNKRICHHLHIRLLSMVSTSMDEVQLRMSTVSAPSKAPRDVRSHSTALPAIIAFIRFAQKSIYIASEGRRACIAKSNPSLARSSIKKFMGIGSQQAPSARSHTHTASRIVYTPAAEPRSAEERQEDRYLGIRTREPRLRRAQTARASRILRGLIGKVFVRDASLGQRSGSWQATVLPFPCSRCATSRPEMASPDTRTLHLQCVPVPFLRQRSKGLTQKLRPFVTSTSICLVFKTE
ncbi:hypothetical protein K437DRAFT_147876 [Tilletiaria anomala UBC 951]|uniref:Uncharacterized protein n=1 Tax=Tilletiaria anomala (strain ATCC 24038 / CBS 436.72 / UBC 951) TaxID=1037660 RepID=A0A066WJN7_TILAU|nr:uncharacterized protein K437DRAFT_147876 [Tilletiaria anomala UBC 951]KDN52773.1 hypothetical protein K437DRAFT_147876 [Tilletiaria anomala UBC 951]